MHNVMENMAKNLHHSLRRYTLVYIKFYSTIMRFTISDPARPTACIWYRRVIPNPCRLSNQYWTWSQTMMTLDNNRRPPQIPQPTHEVLYGPPTPRGAFSGLPGSAQGAPLASPSLGLVRHHVEQESIQRAICVLIAFAE